MDGARDAVKMAREVLTTARQTMTSANGAATEIQNAVGDARAVIKSAQSTLGSAQGIIKDAKSGQGTLPMLLGNREVAENLRALIANIRRHGLLFYRDSAAAEAARREASRGANLPPSRLPSRP